MIKSFKKLNSLFDRRDRIYIIVLFFLMIIGSLLEVLGIGAIPAFVIAVAQPEKILQYELSHNILIALGLTTSEKLLIWGAIALIIIYLFKNLYLALFVYAKSRFVTSRQVKFGTMIFGVYMRAPYTFHLDRNSAELMRNINQETNLIVNGFLLPALTAAMDTMMLVFIFVLLLAVEPLITLSTFLILSISSGLFLRFANRKLKELGKDEQLQRKVKNKTILQGLGSLKEARILGRESSFLQAYSLSASRAARDLRYKQTVAALPKYFIETVVVICVLLIALTLVLQGREISVIVPLLALFGTAAIRLMPLYQQIVSSYTGLRYSLVSIDPIYDDLMELQSLSIERLPMKERNSKLAFKQSIKIEDLSYIYPNSHIPALDRISMEIKQGSVIGLIGPTGAGKTTLVDVILGLLPPSSGKVLVDGIDIAGDLRSWQKNIGYIPQFIYLLDDTIRRNIALGLKNKEIDEVAVSQAVQAAHLQPLISELKNELDTVIGERGVRLSGGQRQRIGIARALYHNPQLLIMDEATSALDNITEKYIIEAIERLKGDRTIIMIAHRLSTVRQCDELYYMKNGLVLAKGSYEELLADSEEFKELAG